MAFYTVTAACKLDDLMKAVFAFIASPTAFGMGQGLRIICQTSQFHSYTREILGYGFIVIQIF